MGYDNRACKATCGNCGATVCWNWGRAQNAPRHWDCKCGMTNVLRSLKEWPHVPRELYVGHDKNSLMKLYPTPPSEAAPEWAQPYSIRSFVAQASERLAGCRYNCSKRGMVMRQPVFSDVCLAPDAGDYEGGHDCHLVGGWTLGEPSCPLWDSISKLCQTEQEKRFLYGYLGLIRDRQFPMLIPQVRVGIAERRRPDFVAFIPLQYWKYKWYAIQLDGAHPKEVAAADDARDADLVKEGYEVRRVVAGAVPEIKLLVEHIDKLMTETDPWTVAVEAQVKSTVETDIPF